MKETEHGIQNAILELLAARVPVESDSNAECIALRRRMILAEIG